MLLAVTRATVEGAFSPIFSHMSSVKQDGVAPGGFLWLMAHLSQRFAVAIGGGDTVSRDVAAVPAVHLPGETELDVLFTICFPGLTAFAQELST